MRLGEGAKNRTIFIIFAWLSVGACRDRRELTQTKSASESHLKQLASKEDYLSLVATNNAGLSHVKFTFELTGSDNVYFQNTARYDFHLPFLVGNIPSFGGLSAPVFQELIFMPVPKDLAAGALFYSDNINIPGTTTTGTMGFSIYQSAVDLDEIERVFNRFKLAIPFAADRLAFLFENPQHYFAFKVRLKQRGIPSMLAIAFAGQGDGPVTYNARTSYGFLRKLTSQQVEAGGYTPRDILVLNELPLDVGPTSGIFTSTPQLPNSHVVLRAINQKIPDIYVPNGSELPAVTQNIDNLVQFTTKENGAFSIMGESAFSAGELASMAENYFATRVDPLPELQSNLTENDFYLFSNGTPAPTLVKSYGSKGANFAILDRALTLAGIDRAAYRGSFLIPFSVFQTHMSQALTVDSCKKARKDCTESFNESCNIPNEKCTSLVGRPVQDFMIEMTEPTHVAKMMSEPKYRKGYLGFAKSLLEKTPFSNENLQRIRVQISASYPPTRRMRFRSSTNAEDLPGLNGAGLYTSKAGCLGDDGNEGDGASACMTQVEIDRTKALITKLQGLDPVRYAEMIKDLTEDLTKKRPIDKAIRKAMASLWNERAFLNRDYYRLPHLKVFMGILCQPSFSDETGNGVAIIRKDPQNTTNLLMSVVTQTDDISITNPEIFGAIPEQISFGYSEAGEVSNLRYGLHSNQVPQGTNVLSTVQIADLARQMSITYRAIRAAYGESDSNATLDMEFKRAANGGMEIKQARPL